MSYGAETVNVHKKLRLDKRAGSENWYARLTLDNGKRIVKSTKTDDLDEAKERALEIYYDTQARIKNQLPAQTRKFKHVAEHAIKRMQTELNEGGGKHYSKYSAILNADVHSGRNMRKKPENAPAATKTADAALMAFDMLENGKLSEELLLAAVGVERDGYVVTEKIAMRALQAKSAELIGEETLLRILNG